MQRGGRGFAWVQKYSVEFQMQCTVVYCRTLSCTAIIHASTARWNQCAVADINLTQHSIVLGGGVHGCQVMGQWIIYNGRRPNYISFTTTLLARSSSLPLNCSSSPSPGSTGPQIYESLNIWPIVTQDGLMAGQLVPKSFAENWKWGQQSFLLQQQHHQNEARHIGHSRIVWIHLVEHGYNLNMADCAKISPTSQLLPSPNTFQKVWTNF